MPRELEPYEKIERSIIKKYRKELWNPFVYAVKRYELIQAGDKIAVCISGGKDSMLMAKLLEELCRHSTVPFELRYICMDPGYNERNRRRIEENAQLLHIPAEFFETDIFEVANLQEKNPCYLCARMRRGNLYAKAQSLGCNKIALGHHFNDVIETTVMGMFYGAQLQAMLPKLCSTNFPGMELIRPLYCVHEDDIIAWQRHNGLEFIRCACRFTEERDSSEDGIGASKRQEVKALLKELKKTSPNIEKSIFNSIHTLSLDTMVGWKSGGVEHTFLETYNKKKALQGGRAMDAALVIMAAGLGTRFGEGIKQLTPVGRHGEIIMDYSIHDAVEAGFNKIVFVIRRDIKDAFYAAIGSRIEGICRGLGVKVECAFQELSELPEGFECPEGRTKPWGTGQAVLAAAGVVDCPFAVINADDYYGKEGFRLLYKSITSPAEPGPMTLYMSGYRLGNTLSETGGVTRGVCVTDEEGWLCAIKETSHIVRRGGAAEADGVELPLDAPVSMNMWGLPREFMDLLREGFVDFLKENGRELKTEFLLPIYIGALLKEGKVRVKVLPTGEKWFGMTYKEDTEAVRRAFAAFEDTGVYKPELFSDL